VWGKILRPVLARPLASAVTAAPEARASIAALQRQAAASGQLPGPVTVRMNRARTVAVVDVPPAGNSHDTASFRALDTLRRQVIPATVGRIPGATVAVTGETAGTTDCRRPWSCSGSGTGTCRDGSSGSSGR
jgi:RND superfamily putative drug exporter